MTKSVCKRTCLLTAQYGCTSDEYVDSNVLMLLNVETDDRTHWVVKYLFYTHDIIRKISCRVQGLVDHPRPVVVDSNGGGGGCFGVPTADCVLCPR